MHLPTLDEIDRELARRSLYEFAVQAWPIVFGNAPFQANWHVKYLADKIQEVLMDKEARNAIVNIFPRSGKSTLISVMSTPFMWLHDPSWKSLNISGGGTLTARDSMRARKIISSEWYKAFGIDWRLSDEQNQKVNFENTRGGQRLSMPIGSNVTGLEGHAILVDDPNGAADLNDAALDDVNARWQTAISDRLIEQRTGKRIIFQQRVHQKDLTGYLLETEPGVWEHVCIRQEFQENDPAGCPADPRTIEGELAFPDRFPENLVEGIKITKGSIFFAGQHNQNPVPPGGAAFDTSKIEVVDVVPVGLRLCRGWDFAYSQGKNDWTVGGLGGMDDEQFFYVLDIQRARIRDPLVLFEQVTQVDGDEPFIRFPRDPGGGNHVADEAEKRAMGHSFDEFRPTSQKESTWMPFAAWVNAGRVKMLRAEWNKPFLNELQAAPRGAHDDQIDAIVASFTHVSQNSGPQWSL